MPVKLRLKRQGRRNWPHYAIVVADSRARRDGRYIEKIGTYDPIAQPGRVYVDHEAALKWLAVGAQPTNTVQNLLRHAGVTVKFALIKQGKTEEEQEKIFGAWWNEKANKAKKKLVIVDVNGVPQETVPTVAKAGYHAPVKKEDPIVVEEAVVEVVAVAEEVAEEAAPAVEETPVAEAPAAEEAPATEE